MKIITYLIIIDGLLLLIGCALAVQALAVHLSAPATGTETLPTSSRPLPGYADLKGSELQPAGDSSLLHK